MEGALSFPHALLVRREVRTYDVHACVVNRQTDSNSTLVSQKSIEPSGNERS